MSKLTVINQVTVTTNLRPNKLMPIT